jgi:hypothetical protein
MTKRCACSQPRFDVPAEPLVPAALASQRASKYRVCPVSKQRRLEHSGLIAAAKLAASSGDRAACKESLHPPALTKQLI